LTAAKIPFVGAGFNAESAAEPQVFPLPGGKGRVLVFAGGHQSSGVLTEWKARDDREGLNMIDVEDPDKSVPKLRKHIGNFHVLVFILLYCLFLLVICSFDQRFPVGLFYVLLSPVRPK